MKVSVEIITGTFIDAEVNENATVKELKEKIATDVKLPVNRLILVVGDEEERRIVMENEDETMLRNVGVCEDSHVYLFFKHPELVYKEERGDDASMEEISSDAESKRRKEEEQQEENVNIDVEEDDKAMNNEEEEDRDQENVKEEEKKEKNGEEEAKEVEQGDN